MADIVVQGEHYKSAEEIMDAVESLQAQLRDLPSDSPEHSALEAHIGRLLDAASGAVNSGAAVIPETPSPHTEAEPEAVAPEPSEDERTTSIIEAAEGKELACPVCGQDVPFPEVPPLDPQVEVCPDCSGWGKTLTGSRVDGHAWRDCPTCQGSGYVQKQGAAEPQSLKVRAAAAPKWDSATWDSDNEWWNPPNTSPPWEGAHWDHYTGEWK